MKTPGWRLTAAVVWVCAARIVSTFLMLLIVVSTTTFVLESVDDYRWVRTLTEPRCCPHATASGHTRTAPQSALAGILSFVAPRSECVGCLVQGVGAGEWRRVLVDRGVLHGVLHDGVHAQARQLHPQALPCASPPAPLPSFPAPNHDDSIISSARLLKDATAVSL